MARDRRDGAGKDRKHLDFAGMSAIWCLMIDELGGQHGSHRLKPKNSSAEISAG